MTVALRLNHPSATVAFSTMPSMIRHSGAHRASRLTPSATARPIPSQIRQRAGFPLLLAFFIALTTRSRTARNLKSFDDRWVELHGSCSSIFISCVAAANLAELWALNDGLHGGGKAVIVRFQFAAHLG